MQTCMSTEAKALLLKAFPENATLQAYLAQQMPTCAIRQHPAVLQRAKRAPSAYQLFIGPCLKGKMAGKGFDPSGSALKACAVEWKSRKLQP